jgi:hypothetical protein
MPVAVTVATTTAIATTSALVRVVMILLMCSNLLVVRRVYAPSGAIACASVTRSELASP